MNIFKKTLTHTAFTIGGFMLLTSNSHAALLDLSNVPLFLQGGVDPNILIVIDDSGSMGWEVLLTPEADAISNSANSGDIDFTPNDNNSSRRRDEWRRLCSGYNVLAYDPLKTYTPWSGIDNNNSAYVDMTNLSLTLDDPYDGFISGNYDDIDQHGYITWNDNNNDGLFDVGECSHPSNNWTVTRCRNDSNCTLIDEVIVGQDGRTAAEEKINYANWYTYYRERAYVAKAATLALVETSTARVGLSTMHDNSSVGTPIVDIDDKDSLTNQDLISKLLLQKNIGNIRPSGGTPTNATLENAGRYFETGNYAAFNNRSFNTTIYPTGSPIQDATGGSCQRNFAVLLSDGYADTSSVSVSNADANTANAWDGGLYADSLSNTLADVAMYYFKTDLSGLNDEVYSENAVASDGKMHQHMETFTVAFGVSGNMTCNPTIDTGCTPSNAGGWPTAIAKNPTSIDDLTHAAYNGRGLFLNAGSPQSLIDSLSGALEQIEGKTSSSAAVAANSGTLNSGTKIFQARFFTEDWRGDLISLPVSDGNTATGGNAESGQPCFGFVIGQVCTGQEAWSGADEIDSQNYDTGRVILTSKPSITATGTARALQGIPFRWPANHTTPGSNELDYSTQGALLIGNAPSGSEQAYGQNLLNYLRGDQSNEESAPTPGLFRDRTNSVLGDIIQSAPAFVAEPRFTFAFDNYDEFVNNPVTPGATAGTRTEMVYVGANDGMLHGFDATTGEEKLAYVPSMIYDKLEFLSDPDYVHRYFVDGPITVGDAYFDNGSGTARWRSVLVAGLRAGGQGIYALDVTNPALFSESSNVTNTVLWEFTDDDLGYTFSQPDIIRLNDGTWAAIFGSGYNNSEADGSASITGNAYLFIVNIANGQLIRKIDTGNIGGAVSVVSPNGLATAVPIDISIDDNAYVDYVYAGDILGNLWRFNLIDTNNANWNATRIFTTSSPDLGNAAQPITSRPSVAFHPDPQKDGVLIYFGTGSYITTADSATSGQETQTFYAVWDDFATAPPAISRNTNGSSDGYLQQTIDFQVPLIAGGEDTIRITSDTDINWAEDNSVTTAGEHHGWYMDLFEVGANNLGERQVTNSVVRGDRVIFNTTLPDSALCSFGGDSWLMELDFASGGRLSSSPLDLNGDGLINDSDIVALSGVNYIAGGMKFDGIMTEVTIIEGANPGDNETKIANTSAGVTVSVQEKPPGGLDGNRQSWTERYQ